MPSPTTPKQWVAPHEISVSTMMSAVVRSGANCGDGWETMPSELSAVDWFAVDACARLPPALAATIPPPDIWRKSRRPILDS